VHARTDAATARLAAAVIASLSLGSAGVAWSAADSSAFSSSFAVCGWLSPPPESTSTERVAEMAGVGFNVALPSIDDPGRREDNLRRLDLAAAHGIRWILWDARFARLLDIEPDSPQGGTLIDSIVADYRAHPAFLGYYMGDEPAPPADDPVSWERLVKIHRELRARDPSIRPGTT
jgi:hypothetical protein